MSTQSNTSTCSSSGASTDGVLGAAASLRETAARWDCVQVYNRTETGSIAAEGSDLSLQQIANSAMVMKSAEDGRRYNAAHVLDGAMDRSVL
jgi:hypothetical protein